MKKPFRFFRGELANSYYLYRLLVAPNNIVDDVLSELEHQGQAKWPTLAGAGEVKMRYADIVHLGRYIGVYPVKIAGVVGPANVIKLSPAFLSMEEKLRSERGLWDTTTGQFEFQNTEEDEPSDPIVDLATSTLRMSIIPEGTAVIGYIAASSVAFDSVGQIVIEDLLESPPASEPYVPYYGEKFLYLAATGDADLIQVTESVFAQYIEAVQRIRREGPTLYLLCELTKAIIGDVVYDLNITPGAYHTITYLTRAILSIEALLRFNTWKLTIRRRFPNVLLTE